MRAHGDDSLPIPRGFKWLENCRLAVTVSSPHLTQGSLTMSRNADLWQVVAFVIDSLERRWSEALHHDAAQARYQDEDSLSRCLTLLPLSVVSIDVFAPS